MSGVASFTLQVFPADPRTGMIGRPMEPFAIPLPRPLLAVHAPTMPGHAQAPSCDPKLLAAVMDSALSIGQRNFARVELGHQRSTKRLVSLADLIARHPGGSLPDKLNQPCVLRAMRRLIDRPRVTHAGVGRVACAVASRSGERRLRLAVRLRQARARRLAGD